MLHLLRQRRVLAHGAGHISSRAMPAAERAPTSMADTGLLSIDGGWAEVHA